MVDEEELKEAEDQLFENIKEANELMAELHNWGFVAGYLIKMTEEALEEHTGDRIDIFNYVREKVESGAGPDYIG